MASDHAALTPGFIDVLQTAVPGTSRFLRPDQQVIAEGDGLQAVVAVASGLLRCVRMTADGRRHVGRLARAGDVIGLGVHRVHRFSVEAITPCSVVAFSAKAIDHAYAERADVRKAIMAAIRTDLAARNRNQFRVGRLPADERVADLVLEILDDPEASDGVRYGFRMPPEDMADYLGLTVEIVGRALGRLQRDGMLTMADSQHFSAVCRSALKAFVKGDEGTG
jgi:CRP-like cAMP-binding protein